MSLYLYRMNAFKNTNNWKKLIVAIKLLLEGRRLNTHYRFLHFIDRDKFTSTNIRDKYNVTLRAANNWIENKIKEGYVRKVEDSKPITYKFTDKANQLATTINEVEKELRKINKVKTNDLPKLMASLKTKYT